LPKSFEARLGELEKIVSALETGNLSLNASLKKYERGSRLVRSCNRTLSKAEERIRRSMERSVKKRTKKKLKKKKKLRRNDEG